MFTSSKMLLLSTLTVCLLTFPIGCDQPDDVVTLDTSAYLTLNPAKLPTNPAGTVYELWVANDTDTLSLGKFGYNYDDGNFLTDQNEDRADEGSFLLEESIDSYSTIFVSVEPTLNDDPASPSAIMLLDLTSKPTIKLIVPGSDSLWGATIRYNMISTSDGSSGFNNGRSIWFANYRTTDESIVDTTNVSWSLDSGRYVNDTTILYDTSVVGITAFTIDSVLEPIGSFDAIDSMWREIIRFDSIFSIDSTDYHPTTLLLSYTVDSASHVAERFSQDNFDVPNLQSYGWKYKGWVVSDRIPSAAVGNMTLPAWRILSPIIQDYDGGLLTTGVFYDISIPDLENPYLDTITRNPARAPLFPGEDFLTNLPAPMVNMPFLPGNGGHVFVSLEPDFYNDTTNFPLIPYIGDMFPEDPSFTLKGMTYTTDAFVGFPIVSVTIEKF